MNPEEKIIAENNKALTTWEHIAKVYNHFSKASARKIKSLGLTQPQFSVIETLGNRGSMKIGQLNKNMIYNGGNMTLVLDQLEKNDLIRRANSRTDRRAILIELTATGKKLFEEIYPNHISHISALMSALSDREQKDLTNILLKLNSH